MAYLELLVSCIQLPLNTFPLTVKLNDPVYTPVAAVYPPPFVDQMLAVDVGTGPITLNESWPEYAVDADAVKIVPLIVAVAAPIELEGIRDPK